MSVLNIIICLNFNRNIRLRKSRAIRFSREEGTEEKELIGQYRMS